MPVTGLARTAVDVAREYGLEDGVIACDQALARGVPRLALTTVLEQMRCWPHVTVARKAVELADPGAENLGESLARLLVVELGFGTPRTQVWVEEAGRRARLDMLLNGHAFEFDGRLKFIGRDRGGVCARRSRGGAVAGEAARGLAPVAGSRHLPHHLGGPVRVSPPRGPASARAGVPPDPDPTRVDAPGFLIGVRLREGCGRG